VLLAMPSLDPKKGVGPNAATVAAQLSQGEAVACLHSRWFC
jgi:hypothetical protein